MNQQRQLTLEHWKYDGRPVPEVKDGLNYLIDGQIKTWQGPSVEIKTCVFYIEDGKIVRPTLGYAPLLDEAEIMRAVDAADRAWDRGMGEWPTMPIEKRIASVQNFLKMMKEVRHEVVERIMWEIGKTLPDSEKEFDRTVQYIADTIEALKVLDREGADFKIEGNFLAQIRYAPIGTTLCMGPYNYPLNETFTTLIPALIMGNPVISKLPRFGQLLNTPLLKAFKESFPAGVVNVVNGRGASIIPPMVRSGKLHSISYIGSSKTADLLKDYHPMPHRLRTVLSLDAKNLGVVLEDADMSVTVPQLVAGALGFNGQRCTAIKMIFVHESRKEELFKGLTAAIEKMTSGFPWSPGVKLTPIADLSAVGFLEGLLKEAKEKGAQVINPHGGERLENYFYPGIIYPVTSEMKLYHAEQFGPLIPVVSFTDTHDVLEYAASSDFGQQVSLFGYNRRQIGCLIDALVNQVSRVNLNVQCQRGPDTFPFTGRKASAEGTLSVSDALKKFSIRSLVATDREEANMNLVHEIIDEKASHFLRRDFIF